MSSTQMPGGITKNRLGSSGRSGTVVQPVVPSVWSTFTGSPVSTAKRCSPSMCLEYCSTRPSRRSTLFAQFRSSSRVPRHRVCHCTQRTPAMSSATASTPISNVRVEYLNTVFVSGYHPGKQDPDRSFATLESIPPADCCTARFCREQTPPRWGPFVQAVGESVGSWRIENRSIEERTSLGNRGFLWVDFRALRTFPTLSLVIGTVPSRFRPLAGPRHCRASRDPHWRWQRNEDRDVPRNSGSRGKLTRRHSSAG